MTYLDLMKTHRYDEVISGARQQLVGYPDDQAAIGRLAGALRAKGEYQEAIGWLERLDTLRKEDEAFNRAAPGHPGSRLEIACLHWQLGDQLKAISLMHDLVAGILSRSIRYAHDTSGMGQGLLLHYMGISTSQSGEASYALDYLRNRVDHLRKRLGVHLSISWPCPVAQYLLGDVSFESMIATANSDGGIRLNLPPEDAAARQERARRYRLAFAMFYDGVKSRARGDEARCLAGMRECHVWESHSNEWYLAGLEILRSNRSS
jgi:tetratricopeptide (TPR) repeat protein